MLPENLKTSPENCSGSYITLGIERANFSKSIFRFKSMLDTIFLICGFKENLLINPYFFNNFDAVSNSFIAKSILLVPTE